MIYRKALSAIVYHYEQGDLTLESARGLALRALNADPSEGRSRAKRRARRMRIEQERSGGSGGQLRCAASGDELEQGAALSGTPRPVSTTRAALEVDDA